MPLGLNNFHQTCCISTALQQLIWLTIDLLTHAVLVLTSGTSADKNFFFENTCCISDNTCCTSGTNQNKVKSLLNLGQIRFKKFCPANYMPSKFCQAQGLDLML